MDPADNIEQADQAVIGVISDTHGLLHQGVIKLFREFDAIIHAGDVCGYGVLQGLREIAPLFAVAGNCDQPHITPGLSSFEVFTIAKTGFLLIHDLNRLDIDPLAVGARVVVHGHTHRAEIRNQGDVIYVNPGSAGPRRFDTARSVAVINISSSEIAVRIVEFGK